MECHFSLYECPHSNGYNVFESKPSRAVMKYTDNELQTPALWDYVIHLQVSPGTVFKHLYRQM